MRNMKKEKVSRSMKATGVRADKGKREGSGDIGGSHDTVDADRESLAKTTQGNWVKKEGSDDRQIYQHSNNQSNKPSINQRTS